MKTKRFFWVFLALLIVSSLVFGACGGADEPVAVVEEPVVEEPMEKAFPGLPGD